MMMTIMMMKVAARFPSLQPWVVPGGSTNISAQIRARGNP